MGEPFLLAMALVLDAFLGEPRALWDRIPHPVVLIGRAIAWLDGRLNTGPPVRRRAAGVAFTALLVGGAVAIGHVIARLPFGEVWATMAAFILLAMRSLSDHVGAVATALPIGLPEARAEVAKIVGRDPETLDESGVARAAIESAAENFSDGVTAPAFWFLVGGLPGMLAYKAVNTADSMIGHRSERYRDFGWAAARLDDALNWVPARLTGALIAVVAGSRRAFRVMGRDARLHASPNAGWPEAAVAGVLNIALAGPRTYGGRLTDDPFVNAEGRRALTPQDVAATMALLWRAWAALLAALLAGLILAALIG